MKKTLLAILLVAFCASVVNAASLKDKATDYNNRIIDLQSKIIKSMLDFAKTFQGRDGATMIKAHGTMVSTMKSAIKEAKTIGPFDGSSKFRDAAVEMFKFYLDIANKEYREIVNILKKKNPGKKGLKRIDEIVQSITVRENALDAKFSKIQVAFTKKYGVELGENRLQKDIDAL
jgi:hypothetical protein